jgi:hypothetical protein
MVHKSYTLNFCLEEWFIDLLMYTYQYKILLRLFHHFSIPFMLFLLDFSIFSFSFCILVYFVAFRILVYFVSLRFVSHFSIFRFVSHFSAFRFVAFPFAF